MKKLIPLILFFILTGFVYAEDKIAVTTKSGITYHWDNYFEKENNYCTLKYYGELCVKKSNTASVIKGEEEKLPPENKVNPNDSHVIQRNKKWQEEYDATVYAKQLEELEEEKGKYEQEKLKRNEYNSTMDRITELEQEQSQDKLNALSTSGRVRSKNEALEKYTREGLKQDKIEREKRKIVRDADLDQLYRNVGLSQERGLQKKTEESERKIQDAERKLRRAESDASSAEMKARSAEMKARSAEMTAQEADRKTQEAERKVRDAENKARFRAIGGF